MQILNEQEHSFPPGYRKTAESRPLFPLVDGDYTPVVTPTEREPFDDSCLPRIRLTMQK